MNSKKQKLLLAYFSALITFVLTGCGSTLGPGTFTGPASDPENPGYTGGTGSSGAGNTQFAFQTTAFSDYSGANTLNTNQQTAPSSAPAFYYDPSFLDGENPWSAMYRMYPQVPANESRALATLGSYKLKIALAQPSYPFPITYQIDLPPSVQWVNDPQCAPLMGIYAGAMNLCIKFTEASRTPITIQASFFGNNQTLVRVLRVLVLPEGQRPNLELAALPQGLEKTFFAGVRNNADRIGTRFVPGTFRVKSTYNGRKLRNVKLLPEGAGTLQEIGPDFVATVNNPGTYFLSAIYENVLGQQISVSKEVVVTGKYNFQLGEQTNDSLNANHRGVLNCSNNTSSPSSVAVSNIEGSTAIAQAMVVPPNGSANSRGMKRRGATAKGYVFGTLEVDGKYTQGVSCRLHIFKNDKDYSQGNKVGSWDIK